jgi:FkbM family methyltransferase
VAAPPVSKALAAVLIPAETFGLESAVGILDVERQKMRTCSFLDETGAPLSCGNETTNIGRIRRWVHSKATVLELGAQYGMTSCEIARAIQNSGRVVTIEPNPRVWAALHRNLISHNCSAHVLQGGLQRGAQKLVDTSNRSATPSNRLDWRQNLVRTVLLSTVQPSSSDYEARVPIHSDYDTNFISNSSQTQNNTDFDVRRVPHVKLSTLLEESGLSFDTIVANCEGCLKAVLESFPQVLETMHTVVFDAGCNLGSQCCQNNRARCVDYEADVLPQLIRAGFEQKGENSTEDEMRGGYVFTRDGWEMDGWLWAGNSDDIPDESTLITTGDQRSTRGERGEQRVLMAGNGTAANGTAAVNVAPQLIANATAALPAARAASTSQLAANASAAAQSARDESDSRWWDPNIWMLQQPNEPHSDNPVSRYMNR